MSNQTIQSDAMKLIDKLDHSVADMLPRPNDPAASARAAGKQGVSK
jgi:hypothetical protein